MWTCVLKSYRTIHRYWIDQTSNIHVEKLRTCRCSHRQVTIKIFVTFYYHFVVKITAFERQHTWFTVEKVKQKVNIFLSSSSLLSINHFAIMLYWPIWTKPNKYKLRSVGAFFVGCFSVFWWTFQHGVFILQELIYKLHHLSLQPHRKKKKSNNSRGSILFSSGIFQQLNKCKPSHSQFSPWFLKLGIAKEITKELKSICHIHHIILVYVELHWWPQSCADL